MTIKEFKNPSALYHDVGKLSSAKQTVEFNWSKFGLLCLFVDIK
jgi:hypothetical protein